MLWIKAFHLVAMVFWLTGLLCLPWLLARHALNTTADCRQSLAAMARALYRHITTPAMAATLILGIGLLSGNWAGYMATGWLHAKLSLVVLLIGYHHLCGYYLKQAVAGTCSRSPGFFYRLSWVPALILTALVILAVVRPL